MEGFAVRRNRRGVVICGVLLLVLAGPWSDRAAGSPPVPFEDGPLTWSAEVNDEDVGAVPEGSPLVLPRDEPLNISVTMENTSERAVTVDDIRLQGRVMGLVFFSFGSGLDVVLEPRESVTREVQLSTAELPRQAVGWMPAELQVVNDDRVVVAEMDFPVDVQGSLLSAYGVFGLAALVITVVLFLGLLVALLRERLPANRWVRGVRFAAPGLGVGLTLTFFFSVTRILVPEADVWLPLVAGCGAVAFLIGYFLPQPTRVEEDGADTPELSASESAAGPQHRQRGRTLVPSAFRRRP